MPPGHRPKQEACVCVDAASEANGSELHLWTYLMGQAEKTRISSCFFHPRADLFRSTSHIHVYHVHVYIAPAIARTYTLYLRIHCERLVHNSTRLDLGLLQLGIAVDL